MEKFHNSGFVEIDGKQEQIAIGEIKEVIEVEVLPGCSRVALLDAMEKIANEKGKTVKADFSGEKLVVEPKS